MTTDPRETPGLLAIGMCRTEGPGVAELDRGEVMVVARGLGIDDVAGEEVMSCSPAYVAERSLAPPYHIRSTRLGEFGSTRWALMPWTPLSSLARHGPAPAAA